MTSVLPEDIFNIKKYYKYINSTGFKTIFQLQNHRSAFTSAREKIGKFSDSMILVALVGRRWKQVIEQISYLLTFYKSLMEAC